MATHSEDDRRLAAALSANVDYLVTGDRELQDLARYGAVTIVSPASLPSFLAFRGKLWGDQQACALCSVAVGLKISAVVDVPNVVVSAFLPLDIFV